VFFGPKTQHDTPKVPHQAVGEVGDVELAQVGLGLLVLVFPDHGAVEFEAIAAVVAVGEGLKFPSAFVLPVPRNPHKYEILSAEVDAGESVLMHTVNGLNDLFDGFDFKILIHLIFSNILTESAIIRLCSHLQQFVIGIQFL
jgi:hypothetical protein